MPKTGPVGPAWPIDAELRAAFEVRLKKELHWGHKELTARVNEIRQARGDEPVSRGAISHALNRAVQSALIPDMERAVGWDPNRRLRGPLAMASGTSGGQESSAQVSVDVVSEFLRSPDQIELVTGYQRLDVGNRASVLERVRVLLEVQQRAKALRQTD